MTKKRIKIAENKKKNKKNNNEKQMKENQIKMEWNK